ncbi:uncharacterized protein CTHT_0054630 [Thermochaetoides thermophila DSM 1495]|uniref:Uncharacterized protein n=1 Tax=Chaetomium thermophilum (strain DSM 1495 / CBS 144.50 / IMI 039719) TaxID=759272 RepID=G0SBS6_CHATD|nr:hypothetical protein CTHT_0054630 [Thermochaetoides thermophila DSM 1495]EGS18852.1 hypothetical protein CTHT_0054630 [Thermochaetoides thermophila DSM 1495]
MSSNRPDALDLRSKSQASISRPLRSPRLHVAGEIPPERSPLEELVHHTVLLQRQLEESAKNGRRISRLPPLTPESPLIVQTRSEYYRSRSQDSHHNDDDDHSVLDRHDNGNSNHLGLGLRTEEVDVNNRPRSVHPTLGQIDPVTDQSIPVPAIPTQFMDSSRGRQPSDAGENGGYFGVGARREQSPGPIERKPSDLEKVITNQSGATANHDGSQKPSPSPATGPCLTNSPERYGGKSSFDGGNLVPPRPLFTKRSSSLQSSPLESTDEEFNSSLSTSMHSQSSRKFSTSSGVMSPAYGSFGRSPSSASDASILPRPTFNFSRPLSRAGTPSFDTRPDMVAPPARQASCDSHTSFLPEENVCTPVSTRSEANREINGDNETSPAPSHIYSKFNLPRGKSVQRNIFEDMNGASSSLDEQVPSSPTQKSSTYPLVGQPPPSPPTRPSSSGGVRQTDDENARRPSSERSKLHDVPACLRPAQQPSPNPSRPSTDDTRPSMDEPRGRSTAPRPSLSAATSDSASTIKPSHHSSNPVGPAMAELSAEEHVSKAIALHENGSLQESTWHLQHAAKMGHPTGMLLYALACRHGWGMRPNPREGVEWLRRAAESAHLEIAEDEEMVKEGKHVDSAERKTRKAQFALSIYELGVSHMNGWGVEQDKALALRCFEIAASWGDVDAMAEAGFCYAQGIGCKKDLKKSAKYYREAEARGMSMVGNSWIHKPKYADDPPKDQQRSKSRTRKSIFSRRKDA